jgi:DNA-binding transcriptional regulator GbsR (MarR family)
MKPLDSAKYEMIEAGGRTAQSFGVNRLLGQLYMYLFMTPEARCLDELAESLGVSKASVSIACRQLESWGALRKVWKKGDRKDYYEAVTEIGHIVNNGLMAAIKKKLDSAHLQIERSMDYLAQSDGDDPERVAFIKQRLEQAEKYRSRIEKLLNNPIVRKLI